LKNPIAEKYYDWRWDARSPLAASFNFEITSLGNLFHSISATERPTRTGCRAAATLPSQMACAPVTLLHHHDMATSQPACGSPPPPPLAYSTVTARSRNGPHALPWGNARTHPADGPQHRQRMHPRHTACRKIAETLGDVNVRSHTFRFVSPQKKPMPKVPNAFAKCCITRGQTDDVGRRCHEDVDGPGHGAWLTLTEQISFEEEPRGRRWRQRTGASGLAAIVKKKFPPQMLDAKPDISKNPDSEPRSKKPLQRDSPASSDARAHHLGGAFVPGTG